MTVTSLGPAAPGWPASGAVLDGGSLHTVSRNLSPTRIATIDVGTGALLSERSIGVGDGAWGLVAAPDGVYLGLFGARGRGNLYRLTSSGLAPVALISTDFIWDLTLSPDGRIVGVCTNPSLVFAYDRSANAASDIGILRSGQRPRTCTRAGGRVVIGGAQRDVAFMVAALPDGSGRVEVLPASLATDATVYCSSQLAGGRVAVGTGGRGLERPAVAVVDLADPDAAAVVRLPREALVDTVTSHGGVVYATARPSGALYRVDPTDRSVARLTVPVPLSETRQLDHTGTVLVGTSADGSVWTYDPIADTTAVADPAATGLISRPQRPQSIVATHDHVDVGGSFTLTRHAIAGGTPQTHHLPGEAKDMVAVADTTYLALYPVAEVWTWPDGAAAPVRLTRLPAEQLRPISIAYAPLLDAIVVTSTDDVTRSALHVVDPVTGRVDTVYEPLGPGQTAAALLVDGTDVLVGGSGATPVLGAFDLLEGALRWRIDSGLPEGFILGLDRSGQEVVVSTSRGWLARVDLSTRTVLRTSRAAPTAGRMRRAGLSLLLCTGDRLLAVNRANLSTTVVERALAAEVWGWPPLAVDPSSTPWLISGRDLVRSALPTPPPAP